MFVIVLLVTHVEPFSFISVIQPKHLVARNPWNQARHESWEMIHSLVATQYICVFLHSCGLNTSLYFSSLIYLMLCLSFIFSHSSALSVLRSVSLKVELWCHKNPGQMLKIERRLASLWVPPSSVSFTLLYWISSSLKMYVFHLIMLCHRDYNYSTSSKFEFVL